MNDKNQIEERQDRIGTDMKETHTSVEEANHFQ